MPKTLTTTLHHITGRRFMGETPEGMRTMIDNEKIARTGPSPMQLVLHAVAACAAVDIVTMIGKRRLEIKDYRIEVTGERPDAVPAPFERIITRHIFDVPGLDEATARRFVELATHKYCSVGSSLKAEAVVQVELLHDADALEVPQVD